MDKINAAPCSDWLPAGRGDKISVVRSNLRFCLLVFVVCVVACLFRVVCFVEVVVCVLCQIRKVNVLISHLTGMFFFVFCFSSVLVISGSLL